MTLAFYVFVVPVLLGYCLFVGISGRLNPISIPTIKQDRASWALGIWAGLTVTLVLLFAIRTVYDISLPDVKELLWQIAFQLAIVITPALALYGFYRYSVAKTPPMQAGPVSDNKTTVIETQQVTASRPLNPTTDSIVSGHDGGTSMPYRGERQWNKPQEVPVEHPDVDPDKNTLQDKLKAEIALRKQTERHLRITRKALSVLESETRESYIIKSDAQIELEQNLSESQASAATLEADAMQEKAKRLEKEQQVLELKQKIIKAKQEIRRGASARARALSTANKSIAFARQSVKIRTRLESELEQAHKSIDNRQKTINTLVHALDKEKRRTQKEIALVAKQIILHERQIRARRSLEEIARGVENKLTSRLVKKVAKARVSDVKFK